jgi:AcrR family transcriptional regulator
MPRVGLSEEVIADTAGRLMDSEGSSSLTLARLAAELGVKPPSLYGHVDGLAGLTRLVAIDGIRRLGEACRAAVMGRSGEDGLKAIANAYRGWALQHPGVYPLTQVARPDDEEQGVAAGRLLEPVLAVLRSLGLPENELIHAARTVRGALHGFVQLETQRGFGLDVPVEESFAWMLDALSSAMTAELRP